MSFWEELKRRNVIRCGAAYLVLSWLLIQVADTIAPLMGLSESAPRFVLFVLIVLFPVVIFMAWVFEITPEGIKQTATVPASESITHVTGQKLNYVVTGLLGLAVVFMLVDSYILDARDPVSRAESIALPQVQQETASPEGAEESAAVLPNSVAVLPLDNLSPDPDNAFFAAGMHEELLNQLAKLRELNVISRTSVLRYAENRPPIPEIARELNVGSVIEGSVRFDGESVLVSVQLIDAATDSHLWSERYERELAGIFAIQADIAMNVANTLQAEFTQEEQERIERPPTDNPVAYALFLQMWSENLGGAERGGDRMLELLDQAIALDPEFAAAYGQKALVYVASLINTTQTTTGVEREVLESLARENISTALEFDPESRRALMALGNLDAISWRWAEAERTYARALEVDDRSGAQALWFWSWSGNQAEAFRLAERNLTLDPLAFPSHWWRGIVSNYAGDYDGAAADFRNAIEIVPVLPIAHSWLALTEIARGNVDAAAGELRLTEQLLGANPSVISLLDVCYGYARIRDQQNAQRVCNQVRMAAEAGEDIGAGGWALLSLANDNVDEALLWLERGVDAASRLEIDPGFYTLMNFRMNYSNDPILDRPVFVSVRERLRGD